MQSINPATGDVIARFEPEDDAAARSKIVGAADAFKSFRHLALNTRAGLLARVGQLLRERADTLGALMAREMGKPIVQAEGELKKCADCCDYFAASAAKFLTPMSSPTHLPESYVRFEPLGPVLAIMPWNFPFWQVFRFAAPALMAGNVAVLKHAPNVQGCADAIERLFVDAGYPANTFVNLRITNEQTESIIDQPQIVAVTLTGSERAGSRVASLAGKALKKTVMELGGSDAFIVLPDADIAAVAKAACAARCINSGQSCIAAKRFIVVEPVADAFEQAFAAEMSAQKVGDPMDRQTQIGPLARADLRVGLHRQVQATLDAGAVALTGGHPLPGPGYFYAPTVLAGVQPGMAAFEEETFGPVAAVLRAQDEDDAIRLANQSAYGLGASIWTRDPERAKGLIPQLEAGTVCINMAVASDPRLPFGGIKRSGWGRELGAWGMHEFINVKTVCIA